MFYYYLSNLFSCSKETDTSIVYISRFVRVILAQVPCESSLYRSNFDPRRESSRPPTHKFVLSVCCVFSFSRRSFVCLVVTRCYSSLLVVTRRRLVVTRCYSCVCRCLCFLVVVSCVSLFVYVTWSPLVSLLLINHLFPLQVVYLRPAKLLAW